MTGAGADSVGTASGGTPEAESTVEACRAEDVAEAWEDLANRTKSPPWLRFGWLTAWTEAFGTAPLEALTVRRGARLAGLVPLVRRRGALFSPTNWHTPDFRLLVEDESARQTLVRALFAGGPRRVSFAFLTSGDDDTDVIRRAAEDARYRVLLRELEQSPYVSTAGDWDEYQQGLDRHFLSEARRRRRRLDEEGTVSVEIADGRNGLEELLADGFRVEAAGWKGREGTAISSAEDTRRFYTDIARWASEKGWLRLAFLRLDGNALAFQFLLEYDGVLSQLKGGYDEAYRKFSPGNLLTHELLARAFAADITSYEFLGGDEAFKRDWTDTVRERMLLQAFAPTLPGRVDRSAFAYGRPLVKRVLAVLRR